MTGFVGINPVDLVGVADTADQYAVRLELVQDGLSSVLDRHVPFTGAVPILVAAGRVLRNKAVELRWRARVIDDAQTAGVSGLAPLTSKRWLAEFAASEVFSLRNWADAFEAWRSEAWLLEMSQLTPAAIATAFASISPEVARSMARTHPDLVGDLNGAPVEVRYEANRILIGREIERLEVVIEKTRSQGHAGGPAGVVVAKLEVRIEEYRCWIAEGRQILLFDPRGDGRIIEVFGDLAAADRVAVVVPGMANDLSNFGAGDGSLRMDASALYWATNRSGIATIAWLGYDTPDGVDASSRAAAERGAPELARFLLGLDAFNDKAVTVVAHSYGSVLAGIAAAGGIEADNLVFVGSPGTTLDHADDAILRSGGRVWSALAAGDPIGLGIDPAASYRWWHGFSPLLHAIGVAAAMVARDELWHGVNPVAEEFGARRLTTEGSSGHSGYFEAGALENLARILEGRYSEVGTS